MKSLASVDNFGAVDADNDDLLLKSFEDHEAYRNIREFRNFLVIGRKGSGKTAIFKHMLRNTERTNYFCFGHTFSDYPWSYHNMQARIGIPDFDKFTHSWKYLILLTVSKILLNQDQSLPYDETSAEYMANVESFVVDSYGSRDPDVTQIFTPSKRLKLKPYFEINLGILKAGTSPDSVPMEELPNIVQEVNRNLLEYVIGCLNPEHEYFICFDQLDLGFEPSEPDYNSRLIGLLLACRDINVLAKQRGKKLFVTVFLRDDIYETLHFEDKNKLTENFVSTIEWDTPRTDKSLKQLMQKRFDAVLGDSDIEKVSWEDVFDETKEMPGHQTKYKHILDRTYLRPRDIIKFCNATLEQYKARSQSLLLPSVDSSKIENADVNKARLEYSEYLRNELDDEIHKHLPNYREYLELLRSLGNWQFERKQFEEVYKKQGELLHADSSKVLEELYEFSLIGFYRAGGRGYGGSEYVFRYQNPRTQFDKTSVRFRVHLGLVDTLGLKRFVVGEQL